MFTFSQCLWFIQLFLPEKDRLAKGNVSFCPQICLSVHLLLRFHILIICFKTTGDIGIQLCMNDVCRVFYKYSSICYEMAQKKPCNSYFWLAETSSLSYLLVVANNVSVVLHRNSSFHNVTVKNMATMGSSCFWFADSNNACFW
jgi:hypothetical protein